MIKNNGEKATIGKLWSISMVLILILSSLLVSFVLRDEPQSAAGESPSTPVGTITGTLDDRYFGWNVSSAGDINEDGYTDIIVGAPYSGAEVEAGDWWNDNWTYRQRLTFDNSDQSEDLTNFPVLVNLSSLNFDYAKANPDASDLRFIDADSITELTYHIEEWNSSGESYIWINVTQIDGNSNSDYMWMYYGFPGAGDAQNAPGTYDDNYIGVWHLNETTGDVGDATGNGHTGTAMGGLNRNAKGKIDSTYDFAGDDDWIDYGTASGGASWAWITGDITLEVWINIDTVPLTTNYGIFDMGTSGEAEADNWQYEFILTPDGSVMDIELGHEYGAGINQYATFDTNLQTATWYYLAATRSASLQEWRLYVDGSQFGSAYNYANGPTGGSNGILMAFRDWFNPPGWVYTDGRIDEMRMSTIPRSADWIKAQHLSMTDDFITFGNEEIKNGTCGAAYIFYGGPGIMGDITAGSADITINGSVLNDRFGWSVAAGDIIGDNTTDIFVGAPGYDGDMGAVYIFDGDSLSADADGRLVATEAIMMISGENPGDEFGCAVSGVGDVDDDGFDDVIVGAPEYGASRGRAYLFFADGGLPSNASDADVFLAGVADGSNFGHSVSGAGDMNGDGYCDVIVGAPGEDRAYIYFGDRNMTTSRLLKPLTLGAQDDTGDNIDDLKRDDGSYYTVAKNGRTMFLETFNITGLTGKVTGATLYVQYYTQNNYGSNDNITWALDGELLQDTDIEITQSAAEVTPPGYDLFAQGVDTINELGALDISFTNTDTGGQKNAFFDYVWIEVTTNAAVPMVVLNGSGDFGWSVSGNGDVNGDGFGDVVIGAPDLSGTSPGQAHIKEGNLQSFDNETTGANPINWTQHGTYTAVINDTMFYGSSGKSMELNDTGGGMDNVEIRKTFSPAKNGVIEFYARTSVTSIENLMIDISRGDPGFIANMGAWIYFTDNNDIRCMIGDGAGGNVPVVLQKYSIDTWYHLRVVFDSTSDTYSVWVDGKLKMGNGNYMLDNDFDYIDTLNIRTTQGGTNQAFIESVTVLTSNIENTINGESSGDRFGYSVGNSGNPNGDSYDDIIVGAPNANGNGSAYIFHGNDSWNPVISFAEANNTLVGEYANDCFGWSVSFAGDVNNDGQNNFIVGAPFYDDGANMDAGKAYIFFGPSVTYQPDLWINGNIDNVYQAMPAGAQINISLISAGDNATWWIVIQNDGSENETFDFSITDNMLPGWTWEFVENGTGKAVNDGDFLSLVSGESRNYTLNISSPVTAGALDESWVEIVTKSQNGTTYDSVMAIARIPGGLPPEISDVQEFPDPQETGRYVNISCEVTDNVMVDNVWLNITLPGGGYNNVSMNPGAVDQWFLNTTYITLGLYKYIIWANDTSNNWNKSSEYDFTIQDTTLPVISNILEFPDPQETGSYINISCDVTDNAGVDKVWINISLPGGGYDNVTMVSGAADQWFHNTTHAAIGLYQYTIWANDTTGNWNFSSGQSFTIQDTSLPVITNVLDVPDPQDTGGWINISCDVTDNMGVNNVWVNISLPGGGYSNVSMDPGAGNQWFHNNTFATIGLYQYTIWANDTSDNWNSSSGHSFTFQDTSFPQISTVLEVPDPQETGGSVNISCDVTDDTGVSSVWVNITLPGGGYSNLSMDKGTADQWFHNNTFAVLGLYQYIIWANDTTGNWNSSWGHDFTIQDTSLPVITSVLDIPDPQETGGFVNISCDVTDNVGVNNVWVNISLPGGGFSNVSMVPGAGDQWFFNNTFIQPGLYQYTVWANDTTGNGDSSSGQFVIQDTTLPTISDVTAFPDPQELNHFVNISAIVTDTVGVFGAWLEIVDPLGGFVGNFSMMYDSVASRYYTNQTYGILGVYQYVIWANDTDGNWIGSSGHTFTIEDITLAIIQNVIDTPDPQEVNGWVNITCNVFDNEAVDEAWVNISLPGGGYTNLSMTQGSGSQWFFNTTFPDIGSYQYTIWVNDTSGNWNSSAGHGFTVLDSGPQLTGSGVVPGSGFIDSLFNFTVNYSHPFNKVPVTITLNLTGPSGGIFGLAEADSADFNYTDGKQYYLTISGLAIGSYSFNFAASDSDGKWVETGTLGYNVINRIPSLSFPQVNPVSGYTDTRFNFTVVYTDLDNHYPDAITLNITGVGIYGLLEADPLDAECTDGKLFYVEIAGIPIGSSYVFHFAANDTLGYWGSETPEIDAPDVSQRTAIMTSFDLTVEYSDNVFLYATLMQNGTHVAGENVGFYIDIDNNGIYDAGEYVGLSQTLGNGIVSIGYTALLVPGIYNYAATYLGTIYSVPNSTAILLVDPKPATITTNDRIVEEGQSATLNAILENEDGFSIPDQNIEFFVDRNKDNIFTGGEYVGSGKTDGSGYVEVTYLPSLSSGTYSIWAKYQGSGNYSVVEGNVFLIIQNTSNIPPLIVTEVPDQIKPEDSAPWVLHLTLYEWDLEDTGEKLSWYLTGVDTSLYSVTGMNSTDDVFTFVPVPNAFGNDEVTLWLVDSSGATASQILWVNLTPVNDRPRIESINPLTVHFDAEYTYFFYNYVSDIEDHKEDLVLSTDDPDHSDVEGLSITFLYPKNMNGTIENVLVTVTDTDGGSTSTIVIVRISDDWVPELETELPDITLHEGETVTNVFDLDDYFTDPDGDALFYVTGQSHVTIDIDFVTHIVNISAPMDWYGSETVSFHALDPSKARVEDIVLITVIPVNDAPSISDVPDLVVRFDQDYLFDLRPYITDEDNSYSDMQLSLIDPVNGMPIPGIGVDPNNNLGMLINLPESLNGFQIQLQIVVSDGIDSNFTNINITVSSDFPPELVMPIPDVSFEEDTQLNNAFNIHNFFMDIDDVYLVYTSGHSNIDVTINYDGSVDFSAPSNWFGSEYITFRAADVSGALVESTITVTVIPVNDAPTIGQMPHQIREQGWIWVLDVSQYLFDIDNDIADLIVSVDSEYVSVVGHTLIFEYPVSLQEDIVTVTVSDGALNGSGPLSVTVTKLETPSSGPLLLDYIFWILLIPIILASLLIGFTAIKRKITAPFVEEVFLIANDGVLIAHNSMSLDEEIDKDILSGMLTGVKNLISDAFAKEEGRQKGLHKLEFGEKNIMLEKSDHFFIALVFSGVENKQLFKKIKNVINELEEKYGKVFESWTGDMEVFVDTDEILEPLLSLEELSNEEREQLKDARKRLKEAKELAIRELDIHLVNLLDEESEKEELSSSLEDLEDPLPTKIDTDDGVE